MPRPHAPGEPLDLRHIPSVSLQALAAPALSREFAAIERIDDGRIRFISGDREIWVGADLACLCSVVDRVCAHQLLAALLLDHPIDHAGPPLVSEARLRESLRTLAAPPPPRTLRDPTLSHALTDPAFATSAPLEPAVAERLRAILAAHPYPGHAALLATQPGRTPGPLRDWGWRQWCQAATSVHHPTMLTDTPWLLALPRWLDSAADAELGPMLDTMPPALLLTLDGAIVREPALGARLARALPPPALARLLGSPLSRAARTHLATGLGHRPAARR